MTGIDSGGQRGPEKSQRPLASPAIGTARNDLIRPCGELVRATPPPRPATEPAIALAFSGGGFRATLAALGVLRFVADAGLLGRVRWVSSVSGGSLANGLFAYHYPELSKEGFSPDAVDEILVAPFVARISNDSLSQALITNIWRTIGTKTRTQLLADFFDRWFFHARRLEDLSPDCRFIFNAANVTTGVRFGFERELVGDYVAGRTYTKGTGLRVAEAAAASAAVPGAFPPFEIRGLDLPCGGGQPQLLLDGGAYDNSGLEALDTIENGLIVALNAGGIFHVGPYGGLPLVSDLQRANALLYRQSTALRYRDIVNRFRAWEEAAEENRPPPKGAMRGVMFGLATTMPTVPTEWAESRDEDVASVELIAGYKTSFSRFPEDICLKLLHRGWWLAGATLSTYHRSVLPADLPPWRPLP
jgi:NTE family protein